MTVYYLFLDDVNGLEDFPAELSNLVIYFRDDEGEKKIISYLDMRINDFDDSYGDYKLEQYLLPTEDDVERIKQYLVKLGY
jgi:hypothetical protein